MRKPEQDGCCAPQQAKGRAGSQQCTCQCAWQTSSLQGRICLCPIWWNVLGTRPASRTPDTRPPSTWCALCKALLCLQGPEPRAGARPPTFPPTSPFHLPYPLEIVCLSAFTDVMLTWSCIDKCGISFKSLNPWAALRSRGVGRMVWEGTGYQPGTCYA